MKIITKHKDYYDFLKGIYGEDPLIVLDRRDCINMNEILGLDFPNNELSQRITLYIGGYKIDGFFAGTKSPHYNGDKIYYGEQLKKIDDYHTLEDNYRKARIKSKFNFGRYIHDKSRINRLYADLDINRDDVSFINMNDRDIEQCIFDCTIKKDSSKLNDKLNCPILYFFGRYKNGKPVVGLYPNLSELNVQTILPPETVYRMISDWISEQRTKIENKIDVRTNIEKLEGKGFDKKISFRNTK